MKSITYLLVVIAVGISFYTPTSQAAKLSDYTVAELLEPCVEGDNDARWGAVAEMECEQYVQGFTDAYLLLVKTGKEAEICLPEQNRPDEVRWAFIRWAHKNFEKRTMPAGEGLRMVIQTQFPCK